MMLSLHFGRHFWLDDDNELMSCPSFVDGNPDTSDDVTTCSNDTVCGSLETCTTDV